MVDKQHSLDASLVPASAPAVPTAATPGAAAVPAPRRGPGHRAADMRDTVAEMAERAHLISQEAGTKVAAAMKDVISAGAGIAGFAIESARDLVAYMVKRGQMTPEEADKLIREAEIAHEKRPASEKIRPTATKVAAERAAVAKAEAAIRAAELAAANPPYRPAVRPVVPPAAVEPEATPSAKSAAKESAKSAPKVATKSATRPAPAKAAKTAAKTPAKAATKSAPKVVKPAAKAAKPATKPGAKKGGKR
jgi:polyhydroxyalkanoate synthesis regulator phasin